MEFGHGAATALARDSGGSAKKIIRESLSFPHLFVHLPFIRAILDSLSFLLFAI